ncbi:hypothetical protein DFH06DRAFT_1475315 [Mycena polygramma]|nr:hypothetical protein DFH06DRAFT_1475315 [Mycena polygramma]
MKVTELVVGPGDYTLQLNDDVPYYWFQTDYERIEERCWGRLSHDSPVPGLCTDLVSSCLVFVFHCGASGRTTLCHAVSGTDIEVFYTQIRYVSGEGPPSQLDVMVFRGDSAWSEIHPEEWQEDLAWVSQTLDRIRVKIPACNASVHPKPLTCGVVLVQKSSGDVIIPTPPSSLAAVTFLQCSPAPSSPATLAKRELVDKFYRIQSTAEFIASKLTTVPCFEVYDGARRLPLPRTSDDTREIFRIATMHPNFPHLEPIQQSDLDILVRVVPNQEMQIYVKGLPKLIQRAGGPCDVAGCRKITTGKCSTCKGAFYCSKTHQEEGWAQHKAWCKRHVYIPGGKVLSLGVSEGTMWQDKAPWM